MPKGASLAGKRRSMLGQAQAAAGAGGRKVVVFLHGAGSFQPDYDRPWVEELTKRLGPFASIPAYYANVLNSSPSVKAFAAAPNSEEQVRFEAAFRDQLRQAYDSIPPMHRTPRVTSFALGDVTAAFGAITRQVSVYLFNRNLAAEIQNCVVQALDQAMANYDEIVFVSHSLGTIIAFDVLHEMGERYNRISCWFTTGCPLGKLRRIGLRGDDLGAITPQNVGRWYNIYDSTDLIADALGPFFPRPGFRLHDIFVDVARDPIASHDYMRSAETLDLIAETMR
jgi:pimeloyl-ACP methyl ester carboxylesterase